MEKLLSVLLGILIVGCVEGSRITIFESAYLPLDSLNVDIHSEISGHISWLYTDEEIFSIKVEIFDESGYNINCTDVDYNTTDHSVTLRIADKCAVTAHASATGTGSSSHIPMFLIWLPTLLFGWKRLKVILLIIITNIITGDADIVPTKHLHMEIKASKRFIYHSINLYIKDGEVIVQGKHPTFAPNMTCRMGHDSEGCPNCCYGSGSCILNQCISNTDDIDISDNENEILEDIFYSHPMDPRLKRIVFENGDIMTLTRAFQQLQRRSLLRHPNLIAVNIWSVQSEFPQIVVLFDSDGLIEEIIDLHSMEYKLRLRRSKTNECLLRLKGNGINNEINICRANETDGENTLTIKRDISDRMYVGNNTTEKVNANNKRRNKKHRHKQRRDRKVTKTKIDYYGYKNFVEYPVSVNRCGYVPGADAIKDNGDVFVYCEILKSPGRANENNNSETSPMNDNESLILMTSVSEKGEFVFSFPDVSAPLEDHVIETKCKSTLFIHKQICLHANLHNIKLVCDSLRQEANVSSAMTFNKTVRLCEIVQDKLLLYCDMPALRNGIVNEACTIRYSRTFASIFSDENIYKIQPFASFRDKTLSGSTAYLSPGKNSLTNHLHLQINDNQPNFKIEKISVIPTDPSPHDIYQVKLEYACATNKTVIKMTVSGSDFYSNHVTCYGVTRCSCCTLHAAGAPNAVVDHVTINVTDTSTGLDLLKEMVVVF